MWNNLQWPFTFNALKVLTLGKKALINIVITARMLTAGGWSCIWPSIIPRKLVEK